jgi:hypothetical protein
MDVEKSDSSDKSSFEDLTNLNENDLKESTPTDPNVPEISEEETVMDVLGNGQLTKQVCIHLFELIFIFQLTFDLF